jgi:serine/threonine-protein kinase
MALIINCPNCTKAMQLPDGSAGKQFRCPACQKPFTVPGASPSNAGVGSSPNVSLGSTPNLNLGAGVATKPAAAAAAPPSAPTKCPACSSDLLPGAVACMDCGYLIQSDAAGADEGPAPNICPNPACGVANPPGERNCARCTTPLPTAPGTVLHGKYKVVKLLAMGGFGAVYLAHDIKNGDRPVAIKDMICADSGEFAIRLNFFRREAEILKSLSVIQIVPRVYDLIEQGQTAHLVIEFIKGQDLLKIMEANNKQPFPVDQVVDWSKNICDVLQHMHTQSPPLVHRDMKPDNLMLLEDKKTIKMIDFGTARDLGRTQKERAAQKTRVYTEGYAPMEQIMGKPEPRSDLFALAATMYHLATGKEPEGFHTAKEIDTQLQAGTIPADQRWFYELIKINLAEDVNERYFTANEIKRDLDKRRVTKELACPKCQQTNKVREPYCMKCAEPLTDGTPPCYHCGKSNRMGSRCCIHCGNRLR